MKKANILIVEDELIIAKSTAKKLNKLGYNVPKIVSSGEDAISYASENTLDLILMDIAIKGNIDGIETANKIKSVIDIPIIFLTAYASDRTIDRASQTGCYGYLIKPFREKELQATIKMSLNKYQEQSIIQKSLQDIINGYSSQFDNVYVNNITKLPNKLFLRDSFEYLLSLVNNNKQVSDCNKSQDSQLIAVFNINLDRLSKIYSGLNKGQQENLIKEISERLTERVSKCSFEGITLHLKENNFVVLIPLEKQIVAKKYGQEILDCLRQTYRIDEKEIFLSLSIGIAFYATDGNSIEELLAQSQKAAEYAYKQGGNRCQIFTFAFNIKHNRAAESLAMEAQLHHAITNNELELYYQPKVNLKSNLVVGAEALLRWNHPTMGRISAGKFIALAEESGLIKPIGEWVLKRACRQIKLWQQMGLDFFPIAINLSGVQFRQSDLFHQITQVLFNAGIEPHCLEIELTETILIENIKTNIQRLNLIKKLGIQIALDDFGTGYSSLGYLQQFSFDVLKIDSCFIRNINRDRVNAVITENVISMAHQLGLKVVAEGVETTAELEYLKQCQCDEIQGYLFSHPLDTKDFTKLICQQFSAIN